MCYLRSASKSKHIQASHMTPILWSTLLPGQHSQQLYSLNEEELDELEKLAPRITEYLGLWQELAEQDTSCTSLQYRWNQFGSEINSACILVAMAEDAHRLLGLLQPKLCCTAFLSAERRKIGSRIHKLWPYKVEVHFNRKDRLSTADQQAATKLIEGSFDYNR
eukprot:2621388-Amphidinium_carterae.1